MANLKAIICAVTIIVLGALFIGFLSAYIAERNKNNDHTDSPVTTPSPSPSPEPPLNEEDVRLNRSILPENYHLTIRSDPNESYFNGTVLIDLLVNDDNQQHITFHCKNLRLERFSVTPSSSDLRPVFIQDLKIDPQRELCTFLLDKSLDKDARYKLLVKYSGVFDNGQITGFYRSQYRTLKNELRYLTATKFEPTYARLAFPCFDEPEFKATFEINVIHPNDLIALSNEIELNTEPLKGSDHGFSRTTFHKTTKMSTYLVAFVVSDFKFSETKTTFGTRVRVYSRPDQVAKTNYAVEAAASILSFYEQYINLPYTFGKMDLIGLPEFVSGAMENWGLVTYKETYVLLDENDSSVVDQRAVASVIAHELAHMWFGNLVTLEWWNDLWIQEGFASFLEYYGQDHYNGSWNVWQRFMVDDIHRAMSTDSLESSHPLSPPKEQVLTPDQITAMFDTISYSKGASILSMIERIIGPDKFRTDARRYIAENQMQNADTDLMIGYFLDDIQQVTGDASGRNFLDGWVFQNGFPIITVKRILIPNSQYYKPRSRQLELTQQKYSSAAVATRKDDLPEEDDREPFHIYVSIKHKNGIEPLKPFVFNTTTATVQLDTVLESNEWIKLNPDGRHYYMVNYQPEDWKLLIDQLNADPATFSIGDRANILFDANRLADISLFPYDKLLNMFQYLSKETHYVPWSVAIQAISSLKNKLNDAGLTSIQFQTFIKQLVADPFDDNVDLMAENSGPMNYEQILLRSNLISLACSADYEPCIRQCSDKFRAWLDGGGSTVLDANVKSYVYKYGLQASTDENDWQRMWEMYETEKDAIEKSKLIAALCATKNPNLLVQLILYTQDQSKINNENFFSVQQSIASSSDVGRNLVWEYIKNHWLDLVERFGLNDRRLGSYVRSVVSGFRTESRLAEVRDFFQRYPDAGAGEAARVEAIETIENNIQWIKDNLPIIAKTLNLPIAEPWTNWRLNEAIRPRHYDLNLTVDVDAEKFNGSVKIEIDVQRPTRSLILHGRDLQITSSAVYTEDGVQVSVEWSSPEFPSKNGGPFLYGPNQFWVMPLNQTILPGTYFAKLTFSGVLRPDLSGLYLSQYVSSETGEKVKLATTQFEAGYARKAFPCFDEPQFKATFTISVQHATNYSAISNMPVDYIQSTTNGMKQTVFEKSVPMPTYLVALVVSDFVAKSSPIQSNFSIYTFNPKINLPKVDYALTIGPKILDYYAKQYFEISYPLPKMDMISVPDFLMGAMENWGLVTYRDVYLLYDEKETTYSAKIRLCQIVAHELAHMWFGNLVTMNWWDDLWLNEGFATFMQYKATNFVEPEWNYPEYFAINELARVYESDSMPSTHSILTKVTDDNSVQAVFDSVTYAKGASIIRMLEHMLGEETFRLGIINYMKKYSYSNTVTNDLWTELTKVETTKTLDVEKFMNTWVRKEGFPVVTVSQETGGMKFKQERFLKDFSNSNTTYIWSIPITYRLIDTLNPDVKNNVEQFKMESSEMLMESLKLGDGDLIKLNVDQTGLFVINYPIEQWNRWIEQLNDPVSSAWNQISTLDRHNLLVDAFYLARSGRLAYDICLRLAEYLKNEQSYVVWQTASEMLSYLRVFMAEQDQGLAMNAWVQKHLINQIYDQVGWTPSQINADDTNQKQLRSLMLNLACSYGHEDCIRRADEEFEKFMNNQTELAPDILSTVLNHGIRNKATRERFDFLRKKYRDALSTNEKMRYLQALSSVRDQQMLQELIDDSLEFDHLRSQDFFTFLAYMASNPIGRGLAWRFYRENYETIQNRYGLDDSNVGRAVYRFAFYFTNDQQREEILDLYREYPEAGASQLYRQQAIELIEANIRWSKSYYNKVIEYFTNKCDRSVCPWNVFRLNPAVRPKTYDLIIQINTTTFQYNGTVNIDVEVTEGAFKYFILHAASTLDVVSSNVSKLNGPESPPEKLSSEDGFKYSPLEFYVIPLREEQRVMVSQKSASYQIKLNFNGSLLNNGVVGLYRGWYERPTADGKKRINLAATQFESTNARKMFPCFDEPSFKSNISITVIHDQQMNTTLSNMNIVSSVAHDSVEQWMVTKYAQTPAMVTYLIAILVSDFHCSQKTVPNIGPPDQDGFPVRTCSSSLFDSKKHQYSINVSVDILYHYQNYTGIRYSFPKLDQIALPQFSPGAMENWGLVKYRENRLLWSSDQDQSEDKRETCAIIAHELAHMWFGNLVTMEFWGDLWLNEAFASYMEYAAVDHAQPDWKYWDVFAISDTYPGMVGDYEQKSEPLVRVVNETSEMGYSSRIVYNKGSAILNMFEKTMGSEQFRKSLQDYLKKLEFKTATTEDLFAEFDKNWDHQAQIDSRKFLDSWTKQMGFPYLNITFNESDKQFSYAQQRFIRTGEKPDENLVYVIPFSYYCMDSSTNALEKKPLQFLEAESGQLEIECDATTQKLVKVNPNFDGFYFANYDPNHWSTLIKNLVDNPPTNLVSRLSVNDRSELILSAYFLSRAKLAPYFTPLELFNYLVHETHYVPWSLHSKFLSNLAWEMERTEYRPSYERFVRRLTTPHYQGTRLWDDSQGTIMDKIFRKTIIQYACSSGHRQCLKDAYGKFSQWKQTSEPIPPNLFLATMIYGIKHSQNEEDYQYVWQQYQTESDQSSKRSGYLEALTYISDSNIAMKYLNMALNETLVPVADFVKFFKNFIHRFEHDRMIWKYFQENYSMLSRKLTTTQMNEILLAFADHTVTEQRKVEMWNLLKDQTKGVSMSGISTAFASVVYNLEWLKENKQKVGEWLSNNACGTMKPEPCPWARLRIDPNVVRPDHYDLIIQVNLNTNIYNGKVNIQVEAMKPFQYIVLHAAQMLQVDLVSVTLVSGNQTRGQLSDVSMFRYQPNHFVVLEFNQTTNPGHYELRFNFTGNLLEAGLSGLYLSNYTDGEQQFKVASTQFEFYDARKVFPCFDEPQFKSTFQLTIIHNSTMKKTLSNTEILEEKPLVGSRGWIETKFKRTLKMVTYLVAMVVSEFVCDTKMIDNITYGVCASHLQSHKFDYALEKAPVCLKHLEQKLGQPYPMSKVDLVAIPDFYYGAMENWGLITFRETALLYHSNDTTSERKMSIMNTIAHELAHFWFGNLVTCEWWNFITLNEGFATYMQYTSLDAAEPDWKVFDLFLMWDFEYALTADAKDTHPLIRNVTETGQIDQADSNIIYSKGATILRMVESVMGTADFYQSLNEYLQDNKYQSVRPENLLEKFDKYFNNKPDDGSIESISDLLHHWIYSNGLPYVNVTKTKDRTYRMVQERFLLQPAKNQTKPTWKIPITYYDQYHAKHTKYLIEVDQEVEIVLPDTDKPIKFNAEHEGFYLVNYSPEIWNEWIEFLQTRTSQQLSAINVNDRSGLLLDAFYLARANLLSYNVPLNLAGYLKKEQHLQPWTIATRGFASIKTYLNQDDSHREQFEQYLRQMAEPLYNELDWKDSGTDVQRQLRSLILDFACANQLEDCLQESSTRFEDWANAIKSNVNNSDQQLIPPPNLLSIVLKYGLKNDQKSSDRWLFLWSQYAQETSATLRTIYMNALANTEDEKLLKMLMNQALESPPKVIRSQDSYASLMAVAGSNSRKSLRLIWEFFQQNYQKMITPGQTSLKMNQVAALLNRIAGNYFFTEGQKNEMQNFLDQNPIQDGLGLTDAQRQNVLDTIDGNLKWMKERMIEVERFLLCGSDDCPFTEYRLNPKIVPQNYDLQIKVDLEQEEFRGSVKINVEVNETTRYVIVHKAATLNVTSSQVFDSQTNTEMEMKRSFSYVPFEFWVLEMKDTIQPPAKIILNFEFESKLATDMLGFYLSKYYDPNKKQESKLAATQFQDTDARRAFPCFDETIFKTTFDVAIQHKSEYRAISNNVIASKSPEPDPEGYVVTKFRTTPKMVTYLLAFIISDFECTEVAPEPGTPLPLVSVCSSPPEVDNTKYAAQMAPRLIAAYQDRLKMEYQLDKMDLVAIPDFSAGAMENWGLLTFRETALLYNEKVTSSASKMSLLAVVAHEIAHMWFGNLVTCEWWTDLWLNEAFASYLEWFSVDMVEPTWNYRQLFYMTDYIAGMDADASITAHPLSRPSIDSPSEVPYITAITYQKGSSILRMFEYVLTQDKFYEQLTAYLQKYQYGSVTADKFLQAISANITIENLNDPIEFFQSWTLKPGFPCLNIVKGNDSEYLVTQQRFLSTGQATSAEDRWVVPLSFYRDYSINADQEVMFIDQREQTIRLTEVNKELPLKFNCDSQGFYIVNYPEDEWLRWAALFNNATQLDRLALTSQDYSHLMYDAYRLANVDQLKWETVIDLLAILKTNRQLSVWYTGASIINQMWPYFRLANTDDSKVLDRLMEKTFQKFAQILVKDVYVEFDLQSNFEDINQQRLLSTVTSFACAYGYDLCLAQALAEFKKWRHNPNPVLSSDVMSVVLRYGIQESGSDDDWHYMWNKYVNEQSTSLKLTYLQALAQTPRPDLLRLLLDRANNQTLVRRQDYLSLYSYMLRTANGYDVAWKYFQENHQAILQNRLSASNMGRLVNYFAAYIHTGQSQKQFEQFFQQNPKHGISVVNMNKALETITTNVGWAQKYRSSVYRKLKQIQTDPIESF